MDQRHPAGRGIVTLSNYQATLTLLAILSEEYRYERIAAAWRALVGECQVAGSPDGERLEIDVRDLGKHLGALCAHLWVNTEEG